MPRLDHIAISVRDWKRSRDWYVQHLGFTVEFENADAKIAGLKDDADLTLIVGEARAVGRDSAAYPAILAQP